MQLPFTVWLRVLHNNHLIITLSPNPLQTRPSPTHPTLRLLLFVCLVSYLWCHILVDLRPLAGEVHLPVMTLIKKTCSPFPRSYQLPTAPRLVRVRLPSHRACESCHDPYEFTGVMALSYPHDTVSLCSSTSSGSQGLCTHSSTCSWALGGECVVEMSRLGLRIP